MEWRADGLHFQPPFHATDRSQLRGEDLLQLRIGRAARKREELLNGWFKR
jgi:hypothetical protein